jgi:hypothetical protein
MAYVEFNNNPVGRRTGDCAVRAISKALNIGWEAAHLMLDVNAISMGDMPSSDLVWGSTLRQNGFYKHLVNEYMTAEDFCELHPKGTYTLAFGGHVATVIDSCLFDAWDSSKEVVQYFWSKEEH